MEEDIVPKITGSHAEKSNEEASSSGGGMSTCLELLASSKMSVDTLVSTWVSVVLRCSQGG